MATPQIRARPRQARGVAAEPVASNGARPILDATARLLRERGYEATTTRAIADRVGIKAASIYHHFPSKDAIVERVMDEGTRLVGDAVGAALHALPVTASPRDRLEAAIRAHLCSSLEHSDYTSAAIRAFAFLPPAVRRRCRRERQRYEQIWRDIVSDSAARGSLAPNISQDVARLMLLGAVNWAGEWYRPPSGSRRTSGRVTIDRIAHDCAAMMFGDAASRSTGGRRRKIIRVSPKEPG